MTARTLDYYRLLGVSRDADDATIKKAFRRLARQYHPDVTRGNKLLEGKFKDITEAYAVLSDPEKRQLYDGHRATTDDLIRDIARENRKDSFQRTAAKPEPEPEAKTQDPAGSGFSDFFDSLFGAKRGFAKKSSERGDDRQVPIEIQLLEAYTGTRKQVLVDRDETCVSCSGTGTQAKQPCRVCKGKGHFSRPKQIEVNVPAGVRSGSRVRIMGEGGSGKHGGGAGDLYLNITVRPHPHFELQENGDIVLELPVSPAEAALGIDLQVPTLAGRVTMKIPAGTQGGQTFRLRGRGLPKIREKGAADQLVKVRIAVPQTLTLEERDLYLQLGRMQRDNPRRHLL